MQISATIIAAQQAARETRAALQMPKPAAQPAASFLAELGAEAPVPAIGETKPASAQAPTAPAPGPMRPGSLLDIKI